MKKLYALVFSVLLIISLSACGGSSNKDNSMFQSSAPENSQVSTDDTESTDAESF